MSSKNPAEKLIDQLDKSQYSLWLLGEELHTYGCLLKALDLEQIQGGRLFGLGARLQKISEKMEKINDRLNSKALNLHREITHREIT